MIIRKKLNNVITQLLDKKLVASCHVIESESIWNWKNEREGTKEYLLQMNTKKSCSTKIFDVIRNVHSYECFGFDIYDISSINKEYLKWIDEEIISD